MRVVLIGAGNVATHFGEALLAAGYHILQVYSRTEQSAGELASRLNATFCSSIHEVVEADLYVYSVSDSALPEVINQMIHTTGIHIHTTGSVGVEVFGNKFSAFGVIYPLQTFSKQKDLDFNQVPLFVEAVSDTVKDHLLQIAEKLSKHVYVANSAQRIQLHIAAVFACNFSNYFYSIAADVLNKAGFPFEVLHSLILETAEKIRTLSPDQAQTGPARRNDQDSVEKHISMINDSEVAELYRVISARITQKYLS